MRTADDHLNSLSKMLTSYELSFTDSLKAGEMIGELQKILQSREDEIIKLNEKLWEMRPLTSYELSKPAKNWR